MIMYIQFSYTYNISINLIFNEKTWFSSLAPSSSSSSGGISPRRCQLSQQGSQYLEENGAAAGQKQSHTLQQTTLSPILETSHFPPRCLWEEGFLFILLMGDPKVNDHQNWMYKNPVAKQGKFQVPTNWLAGFLKHQQWKLHMSQQEVHLNTVQQQIQLLT